ncbi:MAG: NUDIX hydrolase [Alphaproteobacteria bacterium]
MSRAYPDRPLVGVGVVVWRGDRVLLVKRGRPPRQGQWSLPGGAQELGETVLETAVREAREETGLSVRPTGIITAVDSITRDDRGRVQYHYTLVEIAADAGDGEPAAGDDVDDVRWVRLGEVDTVLDWDETRRVIRLSARQRRSARRRVIRPDRVRLRPRPSYGRLMRSPLGSLIARPWLDEVTIRVLADWVFPMSRAWAAATVAGGDLERFCAEVPVDPATVTKSRWLKRSLRDVDRAVARLHDADAHWQGVLFDGGHQSTKAAVAAEEARLDAATALTLARLRFAIFGRAHRLEACRWVLPTEAEVEARHGARLADPSTAYRMPDAVPEVTESRVVASDIGVEHWVRFALPEPAIGSDCWARVYEPEGVDNPPTLIHLHGICMESDHVRGPLREIETFCRRGIRVVTPEAPWHGRRRLPGRYGGEPLVARTPLGALDHFATHVRELAVLTDWARRTSGGAVGWSGISLGAFCCQLAAAHADGWPDAMRADALLLYTTSEGIEEVALTGDIAKAFGVDRRLAAIGWTAEMLRRWRPLTDPQAPPAMGAGNVFMVLGSEDTIAPFEHGLGIAQRWGIPDPHLFVRRQGHFSVPAGMMVDEAPVAAFADHLHGL